jgi:hypothetical protein
MRGGRTQAQVPAAPDDELQRGDEPAARAAQPHSECLIFAASRLTEGPIARVRLPERASSGTYARWAPGAAICGWDS